MCVCTLSIRQGWANRGTLKILYYVYVCMSSEGRKLRGFFFIFVSRESHLALAITTRSETLVLWIDFRMLGDFLFINIVSFFFFFCESCLVGCW